MRKGGGLFEFLLIIYYYILPRIVVVGTYGMTGTSNCLPNIVQLEAKIIKYDVFNVQYEIGNEELQVTTVATAD